MGSGIISRTNVKNPANTSKLGQYRWNGNFGVTQSVAFYSVSIYKDYLIGCSFSSERCKIWNVTTFTPIGLFDKAGYFSSFLCIDSKEICVFGGVHGELIYFKKETLPNPIVKSIQKEYSAVGFDKSPDDQYLMAYYAGL